MSADNEITVQEQIELIKKKLEEQDNLSKEYLNLLQRSQAEFINYKNRIERETREIVFMESSRIFNDFLGYRDILAKAISAETDEKLKDTLTHLLINYDVTLKRFNLEKIDVLGKVFDHNTSDCILQQEVEDEKYNNKVITIIEEGYFQNKRLVKPAKVIVGIYKIKEEIKK
ncbi:MAG: nucleotide exchange factor GrpE [archaeon]|jgi:molecular chaperone GrpE